MLRPRRTRRSQPATVSADKPSAQPRHSQESSRNKPGSKTMTNASLQEYLNDCLSDIEIDRNAKVALQKAISTGVDQFVSEENLKSRLDILFEYEKHYLELIKEYKEEIKFSASLQEDLRRERSQFFTQVLREVSETLKNASVDSTVASQWTQDLVDSYTKSIDLSGDLAKTHVIDVIGKIRESAKSEVKSKVSETRKQTNKKDEG